MNRVTFWAQENPGTRYVRLELPARHLGAKVKTYEIERFKKDPFEGCNGPNVWQLIANPIVLNAARELRDRNNSLMLLEIDDDYTVWEPKYGPNANWTEYATGVENQSSVETHLEAAMDCDGIIVSTPYLASRYDEYNQTFVCRNGVDAADWPERGEDDGIFRIVFAGAAHLDDIQYILKGMEWAAEQPGVECYFVGSSKLRIRGVKHLPWVNSLEEYRKILVDINPNLGLRPMETTKFAASKSDLKILEYAMAGALPLVTPFGQYMEWREDTPVLFAHNDKKEWLQKIKWAVKNQDKIREEAVKLKQIVLEERSVNIIGEDWNVPLCTLVN